MAETTATAARAALFDRTFLAKLERLDLVARKILRGQLRGEHRSLRRGRSLEFHDYRRYQPGDDLRYVDWNIYARLDRLFLKLFSAEEDVTLYLLADKSASMGFGEPSKFDYARRLAAALAYVGANRMDRVEIDAFDTGLRRLMEPLRTRRQLAALLDALAALRAGGETHCAQAVAQFQARVRHPGIVVIIGDLLGAQDASTALRALALHGHDVVVIQVLGEDDIEPPLAGPLRLVDAETGSATAVTVDDGLRAAYQLRLDAQLTELERLSRSLGVEYLRTSTAVPFEDLVLRYLRQGRLFA